ncbi:MAG: hypothetical protein U9Q33_08315 [Campylobacterota bacterium]|nr:hypothetical protein [Campylobacterota bacterium]
MRQFLLIFVAVTFLFGSKSEKMFWDEVKDTNDIELLRLYQKRYPNGIFESLAKIKIDRLKKANKDQKDINTIPNWLKGYTEDYKYYGVGKANKHFKGTQYQSSLANKRAKRKLMKKFKENRLTEKEIEEYLKLVEIKEYKDDKQRIYILHYIEDN